MTTKVNNNEPLLSIIMPVFNEGPTVEKAIERLYDLDLNFELIVVDDCSTDGSREIITKLIKKHRFTMILIGANSGKGNAVIKGSKVAKGRYIIVEDADLELDHKAIPEMISLLEKNPEIQLVNGNRNLHKNKDANLISLTAKVVTMIFMKVLYGQNIKDLLCTYKLCTLENFKSLELSSKRFQLETEILIKAFKKDWKIKEFNVKYYPRKKKQGKKINLADGFQIVWNLIKLRFTK